MAIKMVFIENEKVVSRLQQYRGTVFNIETFVLLALHVFNLYHPEIENIFHS